MMKIEVEPCGALLGRRSFLLTLGMALALGAGCKGGGSPPAFTADELPAAIDKAFAKADAGSRSLAQEAVKALTEKNLPVALAKFQEICSSTSISKEQRDAATRAMLLVNEQIAAAASQGDATATEIIRFHNAEK